MSNPLNVEFSLQYGIYFYKWNLTFHSSANDADIIIAYGAVLLIYF